MAVIRHARSFTLFRAMVVPALLLCAIFHRPIYQWIAVGVSAAWLLIELCVWIVQSMRRQDRPKQTRRPLWTLHRVRDDPKQEETDNDLFLIRQINYRITEQLKECYPAVSWLWEARPLARDLCHGGVWRIQLTNTAPFNYGDVEISPSGKLTITLLQAVALKDADVHRLTVEDDLKPEELLERIDVKSWYFEHGEDLLAQMIDELNTQGHKGILIKEDGNVVVSNSGAEQVVEQINGFPPRIVWEEFCQLLKEDEIAATVQPEGLSLTWHTNKGERYGKRKTL